METVRIYRLTDLRPRYRARLRAAQREAAGVWTLCRDLHLAARQQRSTWPREKAFQHATRGRFALHSQTVQAIFRAFVGTLLPLAGQSIFPLRSRINGPVPYGSVPGLKSRGRWYAAGTL
jgi:hypothetical protein